MTLGDAPVWILPFLDQDKRRLKQGFRKDLTCLHLASERYGYYTHTHTVVSAGYNRIKIEDAPLVSLRRAALSRAPGRTTSLQSQASSVHEELQALRTGSQVTG